MCSKAAVLGVEGRCCCCSAAVEKKMGSLSLLPSSSSLTCLQLADDGRKPFFWDNDGSRAKKCVPK